MARGKRAAGSIAGALQRVRVKSKEERAKSKSKEERGKSKSKGAWQEESVQRGVSLARRFSSNRGKLLGISHQ